MLKGLFLALIVLFIAFDKQCVNLIKWKRKEKAIMTVYGKKEEVITDSKGKQSKRYCYSVHLTTKTTPADLEYYYDTPIDKASSFEVGRQYQAYYDRKNNEVETIINLMPPVYISAIVFLIGFAFSFFVTLLVIGALYPDEISSKTIFYVFGLIVFPILLCILVYYLMIRFAKKNGIDQQSIFSFLKKKFAFLRKDKGISETNNTATKCAEEKQSKSKEVFTIRYCRKCGAKLPEGSMFCNKCGTKIIKPEE